MLVLPGSILVLLGSDAMNDCLPKTLHMCKTAVIVAELTQFCIH